MDSLELPDEPVDRYMMHACNRSVVQYAGMVEDVARMHTWHVRSIVIETCLFTCLFLAFQVWVLTTDQPLAVAFIPLVLHRGLAMIVDVVMLTAGVGWAGPDPSQSSLGIVIVRLLRLTDELGCFLACVMGGFMAATQKFLGPSSGSVKSVFFPIWLATIVQAAVLAGFAASVACNREAQLPHDGVDHALPRPKWRVFMTHFYSRMAIILVNVATIPLAIKLDMALEVAPITWRGIMVYMYTVASVLSAPVMLALLIALCVTADGSRFASSEAARYHMIFNHCALALMSSLLAAVVTALHGAADTLHEDEAGGAAATDGATKRAILLPCVAFSIILVGGCVTLFAGIVPPWRVAFAAQFGVATPTTALRHMLGDGTQHDTPIPGRVPAPTMLVKIGYHRYRRVLHSDDLSALQAQCAPAFFTPTHTSARHGRATSLQPAGACAPRRTPPAASVSRPQLASPHLHASSGTSMIRIHSTPCVSDLVAASSQLPPVAAPTGPTTIMRRAHSTPAPPAGVHSMMDAVRPTTEDATVPLLPNERTLDEISAAPTRGRTRTRNLRLWTQVHATRSAAHRGAASTSRALELDAAADAGHLPAPAAASTRRAGASTTLGGFDFMTPTSQSQCRICYAGDANAVLLECGHGGICVACAQHIIETADAERQAQLEMYGMLPPSPPRALCPLCRADIHHVMQIAPPHTHTSCVIACKVAPRARVAGQAMEAATGVAASVATAQRSSAETMAASLSMLAMALAGTTDGVPMYLARTPPTLAGADSSMDGSRRQAA